ncbi:hypothetical protein KQX54_001651 [Cotesia glomerata]|uniref:Uncharacterized protein n=1 Tax=Cotesia glomerata TaxID=32391 RepID=A0AAV7I7E6_COTGL|nr:hypothetical protein KQX54_001651 [Cotesia glomerata]
MKSSIKGHYNITQDEGATTEIATVSFTCKKFRNKKSKTEHKRKKKIAVQCTKKHHDDIDTWWFAIYMSGASAYVALLFIMVISLGRHIETDLHTKAIELRDAPETS